jgi:hypothetical protein
MRKKLNRREHVHAWHDGVPGAALLQRVSRILDQGVLAMRFLCTAAAAATALFLSINSVAAETTVVATGLANPRGLAFDHHGNLYVAEAGSGGDSDKCIASPEGGVQCLGFTSALTRVDKTGSNPPRHVVRRLPSLAVQPAGDSASGLVDVAFGPLGVPYGVIGFGGPPAARSDLGKGGALMGRVVLFAPPGIAIPIADITGHEARRNPDGGALDSNPYGLDALFFRQIVADAGGNSLIEARPGGRTRTLAVFPNRTVTSPIPPNDEVSVQAVPTSITRGPDGFLYVSQLTGFPFPVGGAHVYRVPPEGGTPEIYAEGFTNVVDIAFGLNGELYVLEIARDSLLVGPPGRLLRVEPGEAPATVMDGLIFPGGVAVDRDGVLYVTNFGTSATNGQVLRITP